MLFESLPTIVFRNLQNSPDGMSLKPGSIKAAIQVAQRVGKIKIIDVTIQNKNEKSNRNGTGTSGPSFWPFVTESLPKRRVTWCSLGRLVGTAWYLYVRNSCGSFSQCWKMQSTWDHLHNFCITSLRMQTKSLKGLRKSMGKGSKKMLEDIFSSLT